MWLTQAHQVYDKRSIIRFPRWQRKPCRRVPAKCATCGGLPCLKNQRAIRNISADSIPKQQYIFTTGLGLKEVGALVHLVLALSIAVLLNVGAARRSIILLSYSFVLVGNLVSVSALTTTLSGTSAVVVPQAAIIIL